MKHMVKMLLASLVICCFVKDAAAQGAEVKGTDNAEQFALLCRIYNVAKNPPIKHVDLQDPLKIVKEIDSMNASFAEEKLFNETEYVVNSSDAQVKPTNTRDAAVTQALVSRITRKAHNILKEIRKMNVTEEIEKVKAEFAHVIFGEEGSETNLCNGALKDVTDRGAACGDSGLKSRGNSAGKNLVVDFFCLCAQRKDDGIENACKVKVGGNGNNHGWSNTAPSGSSSMWASIKKECENLLHQNPSSTKEAYEVIRDFMMHLKAGGLYRWGDTKSAKGSGQKQGMLGTGVGSNDSGTDILCDGKKGGKNAIPGGICVYYGPETEWQSISWLKQLQNALKAVNTINNQTATIQRSIQKLQTLLHRAEQIYETTRVISEIQNPVQPTNLQTAAKRLTAYNAASSHHTYHFILLFVLL